jgi:hypothetical protein
VKKAARGIAYLCYAFWAAAAVALTAAYALVYAPTEAAIADRWAQTAQANADTQRALQTLAGARRVEAARARMHALLARSGERDDVATMASLLHAVSLEARRCGVAVADIEERDAPKGVGSGRTFRGTAVTLEVRGSFGSTLAFLSAIGASQPMLDVGSVAMSEAARSDARGIVESRIQATLYRLSDDALKEFS